MSTPAYLFVGNGVEVDAFGRWRYGVVVKVGRTRVTVRYYSDRAHTHQRVTSFPLARVREFAK